ncbi:MAG: calcium/sodium antiporter, partial [Gammaproteobacteria bacterium]|nr:calcium/sodium antiporter [Gammaproteobacteria bacterium]
MLLIWIGAVVAGLALLVWGSDRFVLGASVTARNLGVPPLVVGLTVIGVGTSAPEFMVGAAASVGGNPGVAIGNAVGSNIANIGLVAGVCALVVPVSVKSEVLRREFPLMFLVIALAWFVLNDGVLGSSDGLLLLAGFAALLGF